MAGRISAEMSKALAARIGYYRDLGIFDFYRRGEAAGASTAEYVTETVTEAVSAPVISVGAETVIAELFASEGRPMPATEPETTIPRKAAAPSFLTDLVMPAAEAVRPEDRAAALEAIRLEIGDCTRCPLAFQGRHKIVFADGDANARLLFVGEGPGADEDAQGLPFVGRAGQLLNNMIVAMGLTRSEVYIANIVKCRPPGNRTPEPVEANTCSQFLFRQIDVVRPEVIVALGATAATYLLGGKSSLASLRGRIHQARGSRLIVTYHPAYLLRDPRQKKEAWADLQIAMKELGLKPKAGTPPA
jgi:uracil-DNA glycosylase family 4